MKCNDTMWLRITKDRLRAELDTMTTVDAISAVKTTYPKPGV